MIKLNISKCTGCRMCEAACSFYHSGQIGRETSRIQVLHLYESGIDGAVVCNQCKERYCMDCPDNAMQIGKYGEIIISPTLCTFCRKCEKNCPIGAIHLYNKIVYICDLCGGRPQCVDACTEDAIQFIPDETEVVSLKDFKDESKSMNVSEKQANYIQKTGKELTNLWRDRS